MNVIQQWRVCAADVIGPDGETGTELQHPWRDTLEGSAVDLDGLREDPIPWGLMWVETRFVSAAVMLANEPAVHAARIAVEEVSAL